MAVAHTNAEAMRLNRYPVRLRGFGCPRGEKLTALRDARQAATNGNIPMVYPKCRTEVLVPRADHARSKFKSQELI